MCYSGILPSADWCFVTDVLGTLISPIFKGQDSWTARPLKMHLHKDHYINVIHKSNKLLSAKRNALDNFLNFILQNEGKSWSEFYRFVNRRKGNRENVPLLKDGNGGLITDPVA